MKTFGKIAALLVAVGMSATIAGCAGCSGCAGCNSSSKNETLTNSNWYTGTSYKGIQPSFIENNDPFSPEKITYSVSYDAASAGNATYAPEYKDGSFKTEFYAKEYDWASDKIPAKYRADKADKEIVYYYRTELKVSVRYVMKKGDNAASEWFDDSVVTECCFRAADKNLQPVYSSRRTKSASPANLQPDSLEKAYRLVDESYENFYNRDCTEVTSVKDGKVDEAKVYGGFNKLNNTLFDNSSLYIAMRSMRLSTDFSQRISLFSAADKGIYDYVVSGADRPFGDEERAAITEVMKAAELYSPAAENDEGIKAVAANIVYAGGDLTGTVQTAWFATVENTDYNVPRATMLKLSVPLSFSLGTLNFTIEKVDSTLWNK